MTGTIAPVDGLLFLEGENHGEQYERTPAGCLAAALVRLYGVLAERTSCGLSPKRARVRCAERMQHLPQAEFRNEGIRLGERKRCSMSSQPGYVRLGLPRSFPGANGFAGGAVGEEHLWYGLVSTGKSGSSAA
jgi:hypothetical protein